MKVKLGIGTMSAILASVVVAGAAGFYFTSKPVERAEAVAAQVPQDDYKDYRLHLLTENFPPFNMAVSGPNFKNFSTAQGITGISADIMRETMKRAGVHYEMTLRFPWSRIYNMAASGKGYGIFSTTFTEERAPTFKWVGPLGDTSMVLIAKSDSTLALDKLEDARSLRIGGYKGDSVAETLKAEGFTVQEAAEDKSNINKLMNGDIDVWATTDPVGPYFAKSMGVTDLKVVLRFKSSQVYLALNKETPDVVVTKLQKAMDSIKADGTFDRINAKYLK